MENLPLLKDADVADKRVLVRVDLDVPIVNSQVENAKRLESSLETINYLLDRQATLIIVGHLGRPKGTDPQFSLLPVVRWFEKKLDLTSEKQKLNEFDAWKLSDGLSILENIRFFPQEQENDLEFSKKLATLADIYINDAFAVSHRSNSSIVGVTKFLPHFAGLRLEKEIEELLRVLKNPMHPLTVIIGGAKMETKLPLVEKMISIADYILVGGKIVEEVNIEDFKSNKKRAQIIPAKLIENKKDIDKESIETFKEILRLSKMVVWNGPLGLIEEGYDNSTKEIAKEIADLKLDSILGGGDTIGCLEKLSLLDRFSFVSMGGGAMLDFLSGQELPGITALKQPLDLKPLM